MVRIHKTAECDAGKHDQCGGTVRAFDTPDGPNSYLCDCRCHTAPRKVTCPSCKGSGETTTREWSNAPGR